MEARGAGDPQLDDLLIFASVEFIDGPGDILGSAGPGTANSHWRDSVLDDELMTGYLGYGSNPLSLLTVRSLTDLGYAVNPGAADPFSLTLAIGAQKSGGSARFPLPNDVDAGPIYRKGPTGRAVRIR